MNVLRTGNKVPNKGNKVPKMSLVGNILEMWPKANIIKSAGGFHA